MLHFRLMHCVKKASFPFFFGLWKISLLKAYVCKSDGWLLLDSVHPDLPKVPADKLGRDKNTHRSRKHVHCHLPYPYLSAITFCFQKWDTQFWSISTVPQLYPAKHTKIRDIQVLIFTFNDNLQCSPTSHGVYKERQQLPPAPQI